MCSGRRRRRGAAGAAGSSTAGTGRCRRRRGRCAPGAPGNGDLGRHQRKKNDPVGIIKRIPGPCPGPERTHSGAGGPFSGPAGGGALPHGGAHPYAHRHVAGGQGPGRADRTVLREGVSPQCQIHVIGGGGPMRRIWRSTPAVWPPTTARSSTG